MQFQWLHNYFSKRNSVYRIYEFELFLMTMVRCYKFRYIYLLSGVIIRKYPRVLALISHRSWPLGVNFRLQFTLIVYATLPWTSLFVHFY